jgi:hypothetical protein
MKKIVILGAFVLVLGGGYTGLWHYNAGHLKQEIENGITIAKGFVGPDAVKYTAIETSGFPAHMTVGIKGLDLNVLGLAKLHCDAYDITRGIFSNTLQDRTEGDIALSTGPIPGSLPDTLELTYKPAKDAHNKVHFKGNEFIQFLTGKMSLNPFQGKKLDASLIDEFESYESKTSGAELVEAKSGKAFFKTGPIDTKFTIDRIDPVSHKISFKTQVTDMELTEELDKFVKQIQEQVFKAAGQDTSFVSLMNISANGKSNMDVEINYKGITDPSAAGKQDMNFDLEIAKFNSSDKMQSGTMHGNFAGTIGKDKEPKAISINMEGTYQATPALTEYLKMTYKKLAQIELDRTAEDQAALEGETVDWAKIISHGISMHADRILPDLDKLGVIKYAVDVKYDGHSHSADINNISILTDKYGLIVNGKAHIEPAQKPKVSLMITLKNHEQMFGVLFDYVIDMLAIANESSPGKMNLPPVDKGLKTKLPEFLSKVAEKHADGTKDLTFKIDIDGDHIRIGDKEPGELLMNLMMLMGAVH